MIDFAKDYHDARWDVVGHAIRVLNDGFAISPEVAPCGAGGGGRRGIKYIGSDEFDDIKSRIEALSPDEAAELYLYLKTKGL